MKNRAQDNALLIDVGNTNTKIGMVYRGVIRESFVFPTLSRETIDTLGMKMLDLFNFMKFSPLDIDTWVVCSVVPQIDPLIKRAGERYSKCPVYFVPTDISLAINNRYAKPGEVGADRLVTAYAARESYSSQGLIVIDFGTATTLEIVQDRDYLGGLICPGVLSSLGALGGETAKLPRIGLELDTTEIQIGISTAKSMNHGFIFGFAAMVEGLCTELSRKLSGEVTVVATGGYSHKIKPVCKSLQEVHEDLLLKGLYLAYFESSLNPEQGGNRNEQNRSPQGQRNT